MKTVTKRVVVDDDNWFDTDPGSIVFVDGIEYTVVKKTHVSTGNWFSEYDLELSQNGQCKKIVK